MVTEIVIEDRIYSIDDDSSPGPGWGSEDVVRLTRVHRIDRVVRGKKHTEKTHDRLLRTYSVDRALEYIAKIENIDVDTVADAYRHGNGGPK